MSAPKPRLLRIRWRVSTLVLALALAAIMVGVVTPRRADAASVLTNPHVVSTTDTAITLAWGWGCTPDYNSACSFDRVQGEYRPAGSTAWQSKVIGGSVLSRPQKMLLDPLSPSTTYELRVRPCMGVGAWSLYCAEWSNTMIATTAPPAPAPPGHFITGAAGATYIQVLWDDVAAEAGYTLYVTPEWRDTRPLEQWTRFDLPANVVSKTVSNLVAGWKYSFKLAACNGGGCSGFASLVVQTTGGAVPMVPVGLDGNTITSSGFNVSWGGGLNLTGLGGVAIPSTATEFQVGYRPAHETGSDDWDGVVLPGDVTKAALQGLTAGWTYAVRVRGCNYHGCSEWSPSLTVQTTGGTTPAKPSGLYDGPLTGLFAQLPATPSITLHWTDNAANETHYEIGYRRAYESEAWKTVSRPANSKQASVAGLEATTAYLFHVRACRLSDCSPWTDALPAATGNAPKPLTVQGPPITRAPLTALPPPAIKATMTPRNAPPPFVLTRGR